MMAEMLTSMRELDSRTSDGILVRMLWSEGDGRLFVSVDDRRTGQAFSVEVPEHARAREVFDHPFVYAT
jgi:hypothetical protein